MIERTLTRNPISNSLNHHQWQRINDLALQIHSSTSRTELIELATQELPITLDTSWSAWNEHDDRIQLNEIHATRCFDSTIRKLLPEVNRLMDSHPVVAGLELIGNLELKDGVHSMTDFKSMRELREIPMWWDVYRHVESRHQLVTQFAVQGDRGVTLTINSDRQFTEEQRTMALVLREHFRVACRRFLIEEELGRHSQYESLRSKLTRREAETLPYLLNGKTNPEIAIILGISPRTAEKHVASIMEKAGVENRRMLITSLGPRQQLDSSG